MRALPYVLALVLGLGAAALSACGSSGSSALIPSSQAGPLSDDFDRVAAAVADGDCGGAARAVQRAQSDLDALPSSVSQRLRDRLQRGVTALASQAQRECLANQAAPTTASTPSTDTSTETTPTDTVATTDTTLTTPTDTTTTTTGPTGGAPTTAPTTPTTTPTATTPATTTTGPTGGAPIP
jgi:hypothetical protein